MEWVRWGDRVNLIVAMAGGYSWPSVIVVTSCLFVTKIEGCDGVG